MLSMSSCRVIGFTASNSSAFAFRTGSVGASAALEYLREDELERRRWRERRPLLGDAPDMLLPLGLGESPLRWIDADSVRPRPAGDVAAVPANAADSIRDKWVCICCRSTLTTRAPSSRRGEAGPLT
jgi:hypothetical protein